MLARRHRMPLLGAPGWLHWLSRHTSQRIRLNEISRIDIRTHRADFPTSRTPAMRRALPELSSPMTEMPISVLQMAVESGCGSLAMDWLAEQLRSGRVRPSQDYWLDGQL